MDLLCGMVGSGGGNTACAGGRHVERSVIIFIDSVREESLAGGKNRGRGAHEKGM